MKTTRANTNIIGISATRASAILGLNNWKTPLLAWQEIMEKIKPGFNKKNGLILPEPEEKAVFDWGHAFESAIIELAEDRQGMSIRDREKLEQDNGKPNAFCYIDGCYGNRREKTKTLHEGKTTNARSFGFNYGESGSDRVPSHVQVQCQHQMMCSGAERNIVSVLVFPRPVDEWQKEGWSIGGNGKDGYLLDNEEKNIHSTPRNWAFVMAEQGYFHQYHIESKPDIHKLLRELYEDFWNKYVITETPPDVVDYGDILRCFPEPKGTLVVSDALAGMCREYKDIGKEIGKSGFLFKRQQMLKTKILDSVRELTTIEDDDSQEKIVLMDQTGKKVGSYNGRTFRS